MNRNLLVTIGVVVIICAFGAYYLLNKSENAAVNPLPQSASASPTTTIEKTSLKNFMTMAGTKTCQFTDMETGNSGSVFLHSGKMRGDFSSEVQGKATISHMINDGSDIYIWMDDQPTGFKTSLEAIEGISGTTGSSQTVDVNKQVDYKCEDWNEDASKFEVPSDKTFNDMTKMMEDAKKMMPSESPLSSSTVGNPQACAACDSLEGEAKTNCKTALKCSF